MLHQIRFDAVIIFLFIQLPQFSELMIAEKTVVSPKFDFNRFATIWMKQSAMT